MTALWTAGALLAFAANSVLCRLALGAAAIDAASFSTVRLGSGALTLTLLGAAAGKRVAAKRGSWTSAAMLFTYAVAFSFAYRTLSASSGALILFGAVQATMILAALGSGERPHFLEWLGLLLAVSGLVYLVSPGLSAPSPSGSALMGLAGISWGIYSLRGRRAGDPLADTGGNFVRALPLAAAVSCATLPHAHLSGEGALLAAVSGALASGLGYVVWYAALRGLTATRAATVQLAVPAIAALGGVLFLSERVSVRLLLAAALILGGVGLAVTSRRSRAAAAPR